MKDDAELKEYFALVEIVSQFDQRLLTVKGWGVSLSLAALGFGFQYRSFGLFLVSAASSLAFWSLEGVIKRHQMRYYPRMRQIEVNRYERVSDEDRRFSAPRIDWSWTQADKVFSKSVDELNSPPTPSVRSTSYTLAWLFPHVAIPHVITFIIGSLLFVLGYFGSLHGFMLGAASKD